MKIKSISWLDKYNAYCEFKTRNGAEINGKMYLRSGISFPSVDPKRAKILPGYITVGAYDLKTKELYLVQEIEFLRIEEIPLFFKTNLDKYALKCYYCSDKESKSDRYMREIRNAVRLEVGKHMPYLINVEIDRDDIQLIFDKILKKEIKFEIDLKFYESLRGFMSNPEMDIPSSVAPVLNILKGLILHPSRNL